MSDTVKTDIDELQTLLGQPGRVVAGVKIKALKVAQLPRFMRAINPILGELRAAGDSPLSVALTDACATQPDAVLAAVSVATAELPADLTDAAALDAAIADRAAWLCSQNMDVLMELVVAVVEVNSDFFLNSPSMATISRLGNGLTVRGQETSQP